MATLLVHTYTPHLERLVLSSLYNLVLFSRSIRSVLTAIIGFMPSPGGGAIGRFAFPFVSKRSTPNSTTATALTMRLRCVPPWPSSPYFGRALVGFPLLSYHDSSHNYAFLAHTVCNKNNKDLLPNVPADPTTPEALSTSVGSVMEDQSRFPTAQIQIEKIERLDDVPPAPEVQYSIFSYASLFSPHPTL